MTNIEYALTREEGIGDCRRGCVSPWELVFVIFSQPSVCHRPSSKQHPTPSSTVGSPLLLLLASPCHPARGQSVKRGSRRRRPPWTTQTTLSARADAATTTTSLLSTSSLAATATSGRPMPQTATTQPSTSTTPMAITNIVSRSSTACLHVSC